MTLSRRFFAYYMEFTSALFELIQCVCVFVCVCVCVSFSIDCVDTHRHTASEAHASATELHTLKP